MFTTTPPRGTRSTDGDGSSLQILDIDGDYSDPTNWEPSAVAGGTPGAFGSLLCDYVIGNDGCNIDDIDALYAGTNGAPSPLTDALIAQWLTQASDAANPLKPTATSVFVSGDVDLDGDVDSTDLGLLLNNFSDNTGLGWGGGNLNTGNAVDSTDLGLLLNNFSFTSPAFAASATSVIAPLPEDVNGDGSVSPLDALQIINFTNANLSGEIDLDSGSLDELLAMDVDGNGIIAPLDALVVINELNRQSNFDASSVDDIFAELDGDDQEDADNDPFIFEDVFVVEV